VTGKEKEYDWASAVAALATTDSNDFLELAKAAQLDPHAGDFSDADFGGLDLSGQNLAGWDLRNAKFLNARLTGTELRSAQLSPEGLIAAVDWEKAHLDDNVRAAAVVAAERRRGVFSKRVSELEFSVRTSQCLKNGEIEYLGDLVQRSEASLIRLPNFGRKSLSEVRELLASMGLQLGMEIIDWSRPMVTSYDPKRDSGNG
jgi:hypothetical protein